jgi:hypothetical protein
MVWASLGNILRKIEVRQITYKDPIEIDIKETDNINISIEFIQDISTQKDDNKVQFTKGESKTIQFTITDENGDPVDLTDHEVIFSVRKYIKDKNYIFQKKNVISGGSDLEIYLADPTTGVGLIYILPEDTSSLYGEGDDFVYDIYYAFGDDIAKYPIIDELILCDGVYRE